MKKLILIAIVIGLFFAGSITYAGMTISNPNTGSFTIEGSSSERSVLRKIQISVQPGSTPNTNINLVEQGDSWNVGATITDATNIAATETSGSFTLASAGGNIVIDVGKTVIVVLSASFVLNDSNSSDGAFRMVRGNVLNNNIRLYPQDGGSGGGISWLANSDAGDLQYIEVVYLTSD